MPLLASDGTLYGSTTAGSHGQTDGLIFHLSPDGKGGWRHTTIYKFCPHRTCSGGSGPYGGLIADAAGNLYGVAYSGGQFNGGVVYELSPSGARVWNETVLHNFEADTFPVARLTYAGAASGAPYDRTSPLYGIDMFGGASGDGQLFSLTPKNGAWTFADLYDFCSKPLCADGSNPTGDLYMNAAADLFGTTNATVFEFTHGELHTIYTFCPSGTCTDGSSPSGGVTADSAGNLYGTTLFGGQFGGSACGSFGCGVIYKLSPQGSGYAQSVLHDFCSLPACADGDNSDSDILIDAAGNLYGTAVNGGAKDGGILFRLSGSNFTVLHDFCTAANCADGRTPESGVTLDGSGNLFGDTHEGGVHGGGGSDHSGGVVYEFTP